MTNRRTFLAVIAALAARPSLARAQRKLPHIGLLSLAKSGNEFPEKQTLEGLRELGWIDGKNVVIEYRYTDGDPALLTQYAAELVNLKVDIMLTFSAGVGVAKKATSTIPVVFGTSQNPVGMAYVATLARPGGNLTGLTYLTDELSAKRLELSKETLSGISRAAVFWDPGHVDNEFKGMLAAAPGLGIKLQSLEIPRPPRLDETERAIKAAVEARAEVFILAPSGFTIANRKRIIELAAKSRLPVISAWSIFADDGALFTYGPNLQAASRRIAVYVDRILKGDKPENLPVEGPTTYEFVVNLKTAKALGIKIPPSILVRADKVIE